MRRPPAFWAHGHDDPRARVLSPLAALVAAATARRMARPGWHAPVPVICCGNAGVGGAGKTTLALDVARRLAARGVAVHLLTRGYGGRVRGVLRVDAAAHDARLVGDEALLLAACAPTWVGGDRAAAARAAVACGAAAIVMDDGLQNPTLEKSCGLLTIDGAAGFGNGRVLPAGPLRETLAACVARVRAAVLIGEDEAGAAAMVPPPLPVLRAALVPGAEIGALAGRAVLAFAGIARPGKFFAMLEAAGVAVTARAGFADHHRFSARDLAGLRGEARRLGAALVTTPKDYVRLPKAARDGLIPIGVSLAWQDDAAWEALLRAAVP